MHGARPTILPLALRQFKDQPRRMRRDVLDDIAQIHERIARTGPFAVGSASLKAPAAGFRRTSCRLNGAFLTIRPLLLPVSSISIYVSIGTPTTFFASGRWTVEMALSHFY